MRQEADFRHGHWVLPMFSYFEPELGRGGGHSGPPWVGNYPKYEKKVLDHVTYQSKANEKLHAIFN